MWIPIEQPIASLLGRNAEDAAGNDPARTEDDRPKGSRSRA
jgi:hypothetical protein